MRVAVKLLSERARLPRRANPGDAGLDLYAAESALIGPGERTSIGTAIAIELPNGLTGLITPRSGLALRHGISMVNAPGLIDPGYRGELRVLLLNTDRDHAFTVNLGDRIAQLLITPFAALDPLEVDQLGATARGADGFGSSGT